MKKEKKESIEQPVRIDTFDDPDDLMPIPKRGRRTEPQDSPQSSQDGAERPHIIEMGATLTGSGLMTTEQAEIEIRDRKKAHQLKLRGG